MRIYDVEQNGDGYYIVTANGVPCKASFQKPKKAWEHAEKLATLYARVKGLRASFTTHPEGGARAAWVVK